MKKLLTAIIAGAALMSMSVFAGQIGVVNMQAIFKQAPQIKQINNTLKTKFAARKTKIMGNGQNLASRYPKIRKKQSGHEQ